MSQLVKPFDHGNKLREHEYDRWDKEVRQRIESRALDFVSKSKVSEAFEYLGQEPMSKFMFASSKTEQIKMTSYPIVQEHDRGSFEPRIGDVARM